VKKKSITRSETVSTIWTPLWGNRKPVPLSGEEINAIHRLSEKTKIPVERFEPVLDYAGQKQLRFRKVSSRENGFVSYAYFFIPIYFERGMPYSHQFCEKEKKAMDLTGDRLCDFIRSHTGIRPSARMRDADLQEETQCNL
jgi:hypothetical protein